MANSVNTNFGATIALQSLNKTNRELDIVQKRVSTGFRVSDAKDDGASFAVAQGLRADVKGNEAVNERLSITKGLLSVTQEALRGITDTMATMRKVVVKLADDALSDEERTQYTNDFLALQGDITKYVSNSTYGGINLLNSNSSYNVISDSSGGVITLTGANIPNSMNATGAAHMVSGVNVRLNVLGTGAGYRLFEAAVSNQVAVIGASMRTVENQDNFIHVLGDTINDAIGAIVDADLAKESAKLQALQIRQQLGTQTLSIANQSPSILVSLFQ